MELPFSTYKVIGLKYFEEANHKVFSDWATELLLLGIESDNIGRLAGVESTFPDRELDNILGKVFKELDLDYYDEIFTGKCYCYYVINLIIKNRITLRKGLKQLYGLVFKLDYENQFMIFYNLYFAYIDIKDFNEKFSFYIQGVNKDNIEKVCYDSFTKWFSENPLDLKLT